MIEVPVTGYVRQFLIKEYGPGPYHIDMDRKNRLRIEFISTHIHGVLFSSVYSHSSVQFSIERSASLVKYYEENKAFFDRGIFGVNEFFQTFFHQVDFVCKYAKMSGKNQNEMNYWQATEQFLERYEITEEMYLAENLYRQLSRQKRSRRVYQGGREIETVSSANIKIRIRPAQFFS